MLMNVRLTNSEADENKFEMNLGLEELLLGSNFNFQVELWQLCICQWAKLADCVQANTDLPIFGFS